jgi:cytoskeletal protein CcmA (bactofilin family)
VKPSEGSTVIGKSVQLKGEITGTEELYVDGKIDGIIRLSGSRLIVGPNAEVNAELYVQDLVVLGRQNGPVEATGRVEIRQNGQLIGDITASRFSVEESASVRGRVNLTGQDGRS